LLKGFRLHVVKLANPILPASLNIPEEGEEVLAVVQSF
jgi:hypothetical protein